MSACCLIYSGTWDICCWTGLPMPFAGGDICSWSSPCLLSSTWHSSGMVLLPDVQNCGLRMRRECRKRISLHRLRRKPLVSNPGMHHRTCVTHVPWCLSGLPTGGGGENFQGMPDACATHNFTYLVRSPCTCLWWSTVNSEKTPHNSPVNEMYEVSLWVHSLTRF